MKIGRKGAIALTAALMISTVSVDSYGAVVKYTPKNSIAVSYSKDEDEDNGPGYEKTYLDDEEEETAAFSGPDVAKVTLSEQYHEEYKIYEEAIANAFFLYTNVANGGMTDEPVSIDIPVNVLYTMEKDGVQIAYTSGQKLYERGTYVLRLTAVENPELPLSEQTEYQTVFRFRIQEKPPEETVEAISADVYDTNGYDSTEELDLIELEEQTLKEETEQKAAETMPESSEAIMENENGEQNPERLDETAAETDQTQAEHVRTQKYDMESGMYIVTLENGISMTSNIPEGYIGPADAQLEVDVMDESDMTLYWNDTPVEFANGYIVSEPGSYRLVIQDEAFVFRIASAVYDLDSYPAPMGMWFTGAYLEAEPLALQSDRMVRMEQDGTYTIFMEGESGEEIEVALRKDTAAPEVYVTVENGIASIQYLSEDIEEIRLEKSGSLVEGFNENSISTPGKYRLTVIDGAGNETVQEFVIKYRMNGYGIAAILLCIAVVAGVTGFVFYTKKNMKIR